MPFARRSRFRRRRFGRKRFGRRAWGNRALTKGVLRRPLPELKTHTRTTAKDTPFALENSFEVINCIDGLGSDTSETGKIGQTITIKKCYISVDLNLPGASSINSLKYRLIVFQRTQPIFTDSAASSSVIGEYFNINSGQNPLVNNTTVNIYASKATDNRRYTTRTLVDKKGVLNMTAASSGIRRKIFDGYVKGYNHKISYNGTNGTNDIIILVGVSDMSIDNRATFNAYSQIHFHDN